MVPSTTFPHDTPSVLLYDPATTEIYTLSLHDALPILIPSVTLFFEPAIARMPPRIGPMHGVDRKSTRLNSSHANISYAVFCLKKKKTQKRGLHTCIPRRC